MAGPSVRVHWDAEEGWYADTPRALTPGEVLGVIAYHKRVQARRIATWPKLSDKRAQAEIALAALTPRTLKQHIVPVQGTTDRILF